jgi:rRNA maturation RNase YbeY
MIQRIASRIVLDGQLDLRPHLFRSRQDRARRSIRALVGMYHHRVDYPGFDFGRPKLERPQERFARSARRPEMEISLLARQRAHRVPGVPFAAFASSSSARSLPATPMLSRSCWPRTRASGGSTATSEAKTRRPDVLSFPGDGERLQDGTLPLGEVVIAVGQAARQARAAGHSLARELRVLLIHGYLHLLGYDHEVDDGTMMRLQARLSRRLLAPGRR